MKEIFHKAKGQRNFIKYVGIGGFDYDPRDNIFPACDRIEEWIETFKSENISEILNKVNYFIYDTFDNDEADSFIEVLGQEVGSIFDRNHQLFKDIISRWYEPGSALFKGLSYVYDDIENDIAKKICGGYDNLIEIEFKDGSVLRPVNDDRENISKKIYDGYGNLIEVELNDGTIIMPQDEDDWRWGWEDFWEQDYVLKADYVKLLADVKMLSDCFTIFKKDILLNESQ